MVGIEREDGFAGFHVHYVDAPMGAGKSRLANDVLDFFRDLLVFEFLWFFSRESN